MRGSLERLLALNEAKFTENIDIADSAYQFLMALYGSFQRYSDKENADPFADMLSLRTYMLTLTDESYENLFKEIREIIGKYSEPEEGGKSRSFSVISAPVAKEEKK